jgi:osmotically-inducible protein OsmY
MAAITRPECSVRLRAGALAVALSLALLSGCGPSRPADDFTLSTKVKIELLADPDLGTMRLDASTLNGVVTLAGTVRSQADVDRAVAAAKRVSGVRAVKSELKIGG